MNNELANEIRSKCDIVDIIGERIPLVARGKNFFGVCPFHDDDCHCCKPIMFYDIEIMFFGAKPPM